MDFKSVDSKLQDMEEGDAICHLTLEYYIKHHEVVSRKLGHARDATDQVENHTAKRYSHLWKEIIQIFHSVSLSEEELRTIEEIIEKLPAQIKKIYDQLVALDQVLQKLIKELDQDCYRDALKFAKEVQKKASAFFNFDVEIYDPVDKNIFKKKNY